MREFKAGESDAGGRADIFVAGQYPGFSRSSLDNLFETGAVLINDSAAKPGHKLRVADKIMVDDSLLYQTPPSIKLPIIYEDSYVIVLNKPAGVLTHSKGALNLEATVASFIKPKVTDQSLQGNRAGIVHRLDRGTSGVIITAKTAAAVKFLQKQFSSRRVKKVYLAVVKGDLEPKAAIIDAPIARNPNRPQTFSVQSTGKSAVTQYQTIKTIKKDGSTYILVELKPQTGRTHQLRVHLAYIGHPIVGDPIYGHDNGQILLHAKSLELKLPSGREIVFEAALPHRFQEFIK